MTSEVKLVHIRLPVDIIRKADDLGKLLGTRSRSATLRMALTIGMAYLESMAKDSLREVSQ